MRSTAWSKSIEKRQFELQESKNTLAAVIDASPVGIVCSDLERRIVWWNRGAKKVYGYSTTEAIGTSVQIVPTAGQDDSREMYQRARSGETIRDRCANAKTTRWFTSRSRRRPCIVR
jgi:PAS domain S-box-containing protein